MNEKFSYTQPPHGSHPVQAFGVITATGQSFYFRCRIDKASLTISKNDQTVVSFDDPNAAAHYAERLDLGIGDDLSPDMVTALVRRWVNAYLSLV